MKKFKDILKQYQFYFFFFFSGAFLLIFYFSMLAYLNGITQNLNYVDVTPNDQIVVTQNKDNDFHSFLADSYKNYGVYNLQDNNQITFNGNINHLQRYNMDALNLKTWKNEEINAQLILIKNNPNQTINNLTIATSSDANIKVETKFMNFINARKNRSNTFIAPFDQHIADWIKTDTKASYTWSSKYQVLPVWITIKTNKEIQTGTHAINLTVNYDNIQIANHTINLAVSDRILPDLADQEYYNLDLWQNWDKVVNYYERETNQEIIINSDEYFKYLDPYLKHLAGMGEEIFNLHVDKFLDITPNGNDINIQWKPNLDIDSYMKRISNYGFKHFTLLNSVLKYQEFKVAFSYAYINDAQMLKAFDTYQKFIFNYFSGSTWYNGNVRPKIYINLDELSPSVFQQGLNDLYDLQGNSNVFYISVDVNYVFWGSQKALETLKQVDRLSISFPYLNFMDNKSHNKVMDLINYRERENKYTSIYSCTDDYPGNFVKSQPGESAWIPLYGLKYNVHNFLRWSYNIWPSDWIEGKGIIEADDPYFQLESGDLYSVYPLDENMQVGLSPRIQLLTYGQEQAIKLEMLKQEQPLPVQNIISKVHEIYWPDNFKPNWKLFTRSLNKNITVDNQLNFLVTELNKL